MKKGWIFYSAFHGFLTNHYSRGGVSQQHGKVGSWYLLYLLPVLFRLGTIRLYTKATRTVSRL